MVPRRSWRSRQSPALCVAELIRGTGIWMPTRRTGLLVNAAPSSYKFLAEIERETRMTAEGTAPASEIRVVPGSAEPAAATLSLSERRQGQ